jgi:DNA-binding transcriptional LysR family regulator
MTMTIAGAGMTVLPALLLRRSPHNGDLAELVEQQRPPSNRIMLAFTGRSLRVARNSAVRDALLRARRNGNCAYCRCSKNAI